MSDTEADMDSNDLLIVARDLRGYLDKIAKLRDRIWEREGYSRDRNETNEAWCHVNMAAEFLHLVAQRQHSAGGEGNG